MPGFGDESWIDARFSFLLDIKKRRTLFRCSMSSEDVSEFQSENFIKINDLARIPWRFGIPSMAELRQSMADRHTAHGNSAAHVWRFGIPRPHLEPKRMCKSLWQALTLPCHQWHDAAQPCHRLILHRNPSIPRSRSGGKRVIMSIASGPRAVQCPGWMRASPGCFPSRT